MAISMKGFSLETLTALVHQNIIGSLIFAFTLSLWPGASMADRQECTDDWVTSPVEWSWSTTRYSSEAQVNVVNTGPDPISKVRMKFTKSGNVYEETTGYGGLAPRESKNVYITITSEDKVSGSTASLVGLRRERNCKTVITLSTGQADPSLSRRLGEYQVGSLTINHFLLESDGKPWQILELSGRIGPDSTFYMESLLKKFSGAIRVVALNSSGGLVKDGISLAGAMNKYKARALITPGAECASSCAVAFLGANDRAMADGASLSFHSPYYQVKNGYRCTEVDELKALFTRQLGGTAGPFAYQRMMDFCGPDQVWTLNKDAAELMGMTNFKGSE